MPQFPRSRQTALDAIESLTENADTEDALTAIALAIVYVGDAIVRFGREINQFGVRTRH